MQAFSAQWVPHPQWVRVENVTITDEHVSRAAELLSLQLGPDGIRRVGGSKWWQWRTADTPLRAEWIEMRADHAERKRNHKGAGGPPSCNRVMLYVHGGAYYFGSVDEHRYQLQRHARKLKARVFAPSYRLAPQFPFPCGLHDCVAAYLYLLTVQAPETVVLAGDSAGGGMVLSMLVVLRDQGIPLPAGAILISPWCDLTHSFPSVSESCPMDYIPASGFHHKPSKAWPPPNAVEMAKIKEEAATIRQKQQRPPSARGQNTLQKEPPTELEAPAEAPLVSVSPDGTTISVQEQVHFYATNELLTHPLVSPVLQPTLGGLPPLLIMVGGGEILRDEQIYLAHKCANPAKYRHPAAAGPEPYKPTDVQLQVWDDLCHVAPTLSFTRPAKYMYRSIAQFGAWALARAQNTGIDILDDDDISVISESASDAAEVRQEEQEQQQQAAAATAAVTTTNGAKPEAVSATPPASKTSSPVDASTVGNLSVGKAGDPLPPFRNHMIRQRVTHHGVLLPLPPARDLPATRVRPSDVGTIQPAMLTKWLATRAAWDKRYARAKAAAHAQLARDLATGLEPCGEGERPPPSALAGRRVVGREYAGWMKKGKGWGLALWGVWGSKHDKLTVERELKAEGEVGADVGRTVVEGDGTEGEGARPFEEIAAQEGVAAPDAAEGEGVSGNREAAAASSPSDDRFLGGRGIGSSPAAEGSRSRSRRRTVVDENQTGPPDLSAVDEMPQVAVEDADDSEVELGVLGKRPKIEGIAMPFSLGREADTASMITLTSRDGPAAVAPGAPVLGASIVAGDADEDEPTQLPEEEKSEERAKEIAEAVDTSGTGGVADKSEGVDKELGLGTATTERPGIETFVTAREELPTLGGGDKAR